MRAEVHQWVIGWQGDVDGWSMMRVETADATDGCS